MNPNTAMETGDEPSIPRALPSPATQVLCLAYGPALFLLAWAAQPSDDSLSRRCGMSTHSPLGDLLYVAGVVATPWGIVRFLRMRARLRATL